MKLRCDLIDIMKGEFDFEGASQVINGLEDTVCRIVLKGLLDPRYSWRTVTGLVEETSLARREIIRVLKLHPDLVRSPHFVDQKGCQLFTLRARPRTWSERFLDIRFVLSRNYLNDVRYDAPELLK